MTGFVHSPNNCKLKKSIVMESITNFKTITVIKKRVYISHCMRIARKKPGN